MSKRWLTIDDFIDVYTKARQRGAGFIFSKINTKATARTKSAFSNSFGRSANWWIIPKVVARWNKLISGDPNKSYEAYVMQEFLSQKESLSMLSLGSGFSTHEITFAQYPNFKRVVCLDIAENRLAKAKQNSDALGLTNMEFVCKSIYDSSFEEHQFDIVLFNASLHHFKAIEQLIVEKIKPALKTKGLLIINEYVGPNRLQFPKHQIKAVNQAIAMIPSSYRTRYQMKLKKNTFRGSGYIRMFLADPSECVDSYSILPTLHKHFEIVVEKPYGGNILMNALKDISHHFVTLDEEKEAILEQLFQFEDEYLTKNPSDFLFGIYRNIN